MPQYSTQYRTAIYTAIGECQYCTVHNSIIPFQKEK